jgi:hypothetical protein
MQEVWTICRIFRRSLSYKKQPQAAGTVVATTAVAAQPDSSSHTGSLESDTGSDEYIMNGMPPLQAPMNNQFHGQWNNGGVDDVPLPPAASSQSAFYHGVQSSLQDAPYDQYYKDGSSWDDIGMMVMELTDPSVFCDCTFA